MSMSFRNVLFKEVPESEEPDGERGRFEPLAMKGDWDILCDEG
jgi:hypothetical protein